MGSLLMMGLMIAASIYLYKRFDQRRNQSDEFDDLMSSTPKQRNSQSISLTMDSISKLTIFKSTVSAIVFTLIAVIGGVLANIYASTAVAITVAAATYILIDRIAVRRIAKMGKGDVYVPAEWQQESH